MNESKKYTKEEEGLIDILKQCTKETYVETVGETGKEPIRRYVAHHVLPSGLHVYSVLDEANTSNDTKLNVTEPYKKSNARRFYVSANEIPIEQIFKNPRGLEMMNQESATIEYKPIEGDGVVKNEITYRMGSTCASVFKEKGIDDSTYSYREGVAEEKLDGILQRLPIRHEEQEDMSGLLIEGIKNGKLDENKKAKYIGEVEKLSKMLEIQKNGPEKNITEKAETIKQEKNPEINKERKDEKTSKIEEILARIDALNLSQEEIEHLTELLQGLKAKQQENQQQNSQPKKEDEQQGG